MIYCGFDTAIGSQNMDVLTFCNRGLLSGIDPQFCPHSVKVSNGKQNLILGYFAGVGVTLNDAARNRRVELVSLKAFIGFNFRQQITGFYSITNGRTYRFD